MPHARSALRNGQLREPAFFAYTYPKPDGIELATVGPEGAGWNASIAEFILPYESVRKSTDPRRAILEFAESTFQAGATRLGSGVADSLLIPDAWFVGPGQTGVRRRVVGSTERVSIALVSSAQRSPYFFR